MKQYNKPRTQYELSERSKELLTKMGKAKNEIEYQELKKEFQASQKSDYQKEYYKGRNKRYVMFFKSGTCLEVQKKMESVESINQYLIHLVEEDIKKNGI